MGKPETIVEDYLALEATKRGGRAAKIQDAGRRGCPDRMLLLNATKPIWVETKAKGGRLSKSQELYRDELKSHGHIVLTLWTIDQVDKFFRFYDEGYFRNESMSDL